MSKNNLNIVIATGILPPEIGGPSTYVLRLAKHLEESGHEVKIVSYGDEKTKAAVGSDIDFNLHIVDKNLPLYLRYFRYFKEIKKLSKWADVVYAQDLVSTGLPCALAKIFKPQIKLAVRLGGDFLWEKAYNNGWTDKALSQYHAQPKNSSEKIYLSVYKFVLKKIDKIVFSTKWQSDIYNKFFHTDKKSVVIANAFPKANKLDKEKNNNILFAGRLIKLKNLSRLIEAIRESCDVKLTIVGSGPEKEDLEKDIAKFSLQDRVTIKPRVSPEKLDQYMASSFLVIVPSISEVSPNVALECIRLGKPILLTKECGFFEKYKEQLIFIDPFSVSDIKEKICALLDENNYNNYLQKISQIDTSRSWQDLTQEHIGLFKKL